MAAPGLKTSLRSGWRKAILKAHCPSATLGFFLLLQPLPWLPPWGLWTWTASSWLLSHQTVARLAPSHSPASLQTSLFKEAFASLPKQSYLSSVALSLTWFYLPLAHILVVCFYVYNFLLWLEWKFHVDRDHINLIPTVDSASLILPGSHYVLNRNFLQEWIKKQWTDEQDNLVQSRWARSKQTLWLVLNHTAAVLFVCLWDQGWAPCEWLGMKQGHGGRGFLFSAPYIKPLHKWFVGDAWNWNRKRGEKEYLDISKVVLLT